MASASGVGAATDVNTILLAIVERIEVSDAYAIHRLDLSLAGRHSDDSTFGGNFTGKLGVRLQLAPELLLRAAPTARANFVPRVWRQGHFWRTGVAGAKSDEVTLRSCRMVHEKPVSDCLRRRFPLIHIVCG